MVPLGSFVTVQHGAGPDRVQHYNGYPTAEINGGPAPGFSSGQAQAAMEKLAKDNLPNGISFEWTELTYQQILAGNTAILVFPLCVLLVFLVLSALYESWSLPLAVILIVPMVLLSAIAGVWLHRWRQQHLHPDRLDRAGRAGVQERDPDRRVRPRTAARRACAATRRCWRRARLRLRPILMTSFAFIMGVVPLVTSHGAGAEMRHAMGVAVFAGMLGVTIFGLISRRCSMSSFAPWSSAARRARPNAPPRMRCRRWKNHVMKSACCKVACALPTAARPSPAVPASVPDYHAGRNLPRRNCRASTPTQENNAQFQAAWWKQFNDPDAGRVDPARRGEQPRPAHRGGAAA